MKKSKKLIIIAVLLIIDILGIVIFFITKTSNQNNEKNETSHLEITQDGAFQTNTIKSIKNNPIELNDVEATNIAVTTNISEDIEISTTKKIILIRKLMDFL